MIGSGRRPAFSAVRSEGALLPADLLRRVETHDRTLGGLTPADYHLPPGETLNEATNRAWNRVLGTWTAFRAWLTRQAAEGPLTGETRDRWLLPLFQELGYGRLQPARGVEQGGKLYPLSHGWGAVPIHLVGVGVDLDARAPGVAGAARSRPHSMVQEFLNASSAHLWAFLSNGTQLRILRDSARLTRQAYVEFDLEAMMESQAYSDFVLLWLLCHQSRVEGEPPTACWLERWSQTAQAEGTRVREQLRQGVEAAITALGHGFLAHPANRVLRQKLRSGALTPQDYYRQLLRLVYRLIFLFVAEDRGLLLDPGAPAEARARYTAYYTTARLRRLAAAQRGGRQGDQYRMLQVVMGCLGRVEGGAALALPALGSFLFASGAHGSLPDLEAADIRNHDLLDAVRALAYTTSGDARRPVDYRDLGSEELGSVYEALLELHPELHADSARFELKTAGGNERKTTGSYYTPPALVAALLNSALDPVLDATARQPDPAAAILHLAICDPACGSGHFLIGAAHRLAHRLAAIRTGEAEPDPAATRAALRQVISRCIYGVDINPMAVELCKFSLWLEALEPGKPLAFLEQHIRCGNSLVGATQALVLAGIPDAAYEPRTGDVKAVAAALRRRNRTERETYRDHQTFQHKMDLTATSGGLSAGVAEAAQEVDRLAGDTMPQIAAKDIAFHTWLDQTAAQRAVYNLWTAAFFWPLTDPDAPAPTTRAVLEALSQAGRRTPLIDASTACGVRLGFFHWELEFASVFVRGGFDVVLGNSPWERIKIQEKEWFAVRRPDIAAAPTAAARQRLISALPEADPALWTAFQDALRQAEGESQFIRGSGRFPLCGRGDVNTYAVFAETDRMLLAPTGRVGCLVPSAVATDDTTKFFFQDLMQKYSLVSLYSFLEVRDFFLGTDSRSSFCLLTLTGPACPSAESTFVFSALTVDELDKSERRFILTAQDIALLNPNTRTCAIFRTEQDAELTKAIYRRVPILIKDGPPEANPWDIRFMTMFHMANDSGLFRTREQLDAGGSHLVGNIFKQDEQTYFPLYEAKLMHQYTHRWATYIVENAHDLTSAELNDPYHYVLPRYWVSSAEIEARLAGRWNRAWLLSFRDITNAVAVRTTIFSLIPAVAVGHTASLALLGAASSAQLTACFLACTNSLVLDYVARQKLGGIHLSYGILKQLPILPPATYAQPASWGAGDELTAWLVPRVLELTYTAWDLAPFARDCGYVGPPFRWDEPRRFLLRCELDAAYFHLYSITRDDVGYILNTFPIMRRKDEVAHGEYRTRRVILEIYDALEQARTSGVAYQTTLAPPPADPRAAHASGAPRPRLGAPCPTLARDSRLEDGGALIHGARDVTEGH